jgi:hypothetical protein
MTTGKPAKGGFDSDGYTLALQNYERMNRALLARPVTPGFAWDRKRKRLVLRGEFANVPKRFLDLSQRSEGYGNADDRAGEFHPMGIVDGDDLLRWMETARRPVRRDFIYSFEFKRAPQDPTLNAARVARFRRFAKADGKCAICGKNPRREGRNNRGKFYRTCYWCSAKAAERVARSREAKKIPLALDGLSAEGVA